MEKTTREALETRRAMGAAIRRCRLAAGLTQTQLASAIAAASGAETNQGNVSKIEKGGVGVSQETLSVIASALGTRPSALYLMAEEYGEDHSVAEVPPAYLTTMPGVTLVPILSWVQAGQPAEAIAAYDRKNPDAWAPTSRRVSPKAYALKVRGKSMTNPSGSPPFPEGTVIIVDPERQAFHGSFVVAKFDDEDEATFKRLEFDGGDRYLVPLNPAFLTTRIDRPATMLGVVVSKAEELID